jgi:hypothetical protein
LQVPTDDQPTGVTWLQQTVRAPHGRVRHLDERPQTTAQAVVGLPRPEYDRDHHADLALVAALAKDKGRRDATYRVLRLLLAVCAGTVGVARRRRGRMP